MSIHYKVIATRYGEAEAISIVHEGPNYTKAIREYADHVDYSNGGRGPYAMTDIVLYHRISDAKQSRPPTAVQ